MSQIVGVDVGRYIFEASRKRVTIFDVPGLTRESVLLITNLTTGTVVYQFNSAAKGGILAGSSLTLEYDTTAMADSDALQIVVHLPTLQQVLDLSITNRLLAEIRDILKLAFQ
jgi:hypothetical protein